MNQQIVDALKELDECYKYEAEDDEDVKDQLPGGDRESAELIFEFGELVDKALFVPMADSPYDRAPNMPAIDALRASGVSIELTEEPGPEDSVARAISITTKDGNGPFEYSY